MKFFGNLAFSSSSVLQYFIMCEFCFQKLSVSFKKFLVSIRFVLPECQTHLEFGVALLEQNIHRL